MRQCGLLLRERVMPLRVKVAETARERMRGLLGRRGLEPDEALLLERCGAVHTFGMRFPIDVVFVGRDARVLAVHRTVRANRLLAHWRGAQTLELQAGAAARLGIGVGHRLVWLEA